MRDLSEARTSSGQILGSQPYCWRPGAGSVSNVARASRVVIILNCLRLVSVNVLPSCALLSRRVIYFMLFGFFFRCFRDLAFGCRSLTRFFQFLSRLYLFFFLYTCTCLSPDWLVLKYNKFINVQNGLFYRVSASG